MVGRLHGFKTVDHPGDMLRRFGFKVFYGMCPGLICYVRQGQNSKLFVVAIDDRESAEHC